MTRKSDKTEENDEFGEPTKEPEPVKTKDVALPATTAVVAQQPTIGRIVIYHDNVVGDLPAIVTAVGSDGKIGLTIFESKGVKYEDDVPTKGEPFARHWHWPTRS